MNQLGRVRRKQRMNVTRHIEWYNQPVNDPYEGKYANMLHSFDAIPAPTKAGVFLFSFLSPTDVLAHP
jgi:hypothetical protein